MNTESWNLDLREPLPELVRDFLLANCTSIFSDPDWLALFARTACNVHEQPLLVVAGSPDLIQAAAAVRIGRMRKGPISVPMLESMTNFYSLDYEIVEPGSAGRELERAGPGIVARTAIAAQLMRMKASVARFGPCSQGAPVDTVQASLESAGFDCIRRASYGNWVEPVGGRDFRAYFESRPSQLRNTYQRRLKRLTSTHELRIDVYRQPGHELENGLRAYQLIYESSWKRPEPYREFIPELVRLAARRGWLRLGVLTASGRPVAAQIWLVYRERSIIYKLAYDDGYKEFSPGLILSVEMFRRAFDDDRVNTIDYGTGDDDYKRDWMTERRQLWTVEGFSRRRLIGKLLRLRRRTWAGEETRASQPE